MSAILTVDSFYEVARQGKLVGLVCPSGHATVPPRRTCLVCSSADLEVKQLSGKGRIRSWTEVFVKSKEFPIDTPYLLAIVELNEGGKLLGVVDEKPSSNLVEGTSVKVEFREVVKGDKWPRIFFRPEE
jgi:uncharacterized OB-fold protein